MQGEQIKFEGGSNFFNRFSKNSELLATSGFNSQPEDLEVKFSKLDPSLKSTKFPNKTRRSIKFTATKSSEFNLNNKKQKH